MREHPSPNRRMWLACCRLSVALRKSEEKEGSRISFSLSFTRPKRMAGIEMGSRRRKFQRTPRTSLMVRLGRWEWRLFAPSFAGISPVDPKDPKYYQLFSQFVSRCLLDCPKNTLLLLNQIPLPMLRCATQIASFWRFPLSQHPRYRICHFHAGVISIVATRQERIILRFVMPDMSDNRQLYCARIQNLGSC